MENAYEDRAFASAAGMLAVAVWAVYILLSIASIPDVPYRMMINSFFGVLACAAVILDYRHWRFAVLLACCVYLVVYAVQLVRMTSMMAGSETPLLSALSFYYSASWTVTNGVFIERGMLGGLTNAFLEYGMPVLVIALILLTLLSRRNRPAAT